MFLDVQVGVGTWMGALSGAAAALGGEGRLALRNVEQLLAAAGLVGQENRVSWGGERRT